MPVRSLNSSVFKWPGKKDVGRSLHAWVERIVREHPELAGVGVFGSYVRTDWGMGSDLDLIILVEHSTLPFERRSVYWHTDDLPVPVDVLVYTEEEWRRLREGRPPKERRGGENVLWLYLRSESRPC